MPSICEGGVPLLLGGEDGGVALPLGGDWEANWPRWLKIVLYMLGLFYCFNGVGLIADRFMGAIERITSSKKRVKRDGKDVTVKIWNDTVANLTLMALGSSAPEILLSLCELVLSEKWHSGALGPSTIVGSAAFNLLVITAVCVSALPDGEVRKIKDLSVFAVTASFSVFAYLWLLIILVANTPDVVDMGEGIITFLFCPLLVVIAYLADVGYFHKFCSKLHKSRLQLTEHTTPDDYEKMHILMADKYGTLPEDSYDREALLYYEFSPPQSRAAHRVNATRGITGGNQVLGRMEKWMRGKAVAQMMRGERKSGKGSVPDALVAFASSHYAVLETEKKVKISVKITRLGNHKDSVKVRYKTRDGTAEAGKDYAKARGQLTFGPNDTEQSFDITIYEDKEHEPTEEFYVDLKDAKGAHIGHVKTATIVVLDTNGPGVLSFDQEELKIPESADKVVVKVDVHRSKGATGAVSCNYRTEDGSAKAGKDFQEAKGTLEFGHGMTTACIPLEILPKGKYESTEDFRVILEEPTGGVLFDADKDGGQECNILTVIIESDPERKRSHWERIMANFNVDEIEIGHANWKDQFKEVIYVGGTKEEQEQCSWLDVVLHILSVPWKFLFAFVPPTDYLGGWLCFFSSLIMIGLLTMIIGDMANLLGCSLDMKAQICAVTFVALGTSLPDTFASRTAARQDQTADNSIGNVTGSNSVNVFLGLGLPWMMGAIYWNIKGATPEWHARGRDMGWLEGLPHIKKNYPNGCFVVPGGNLGTSVGVFVGCACTTIAVLMIRRVYCGGELGGNQKVCWATSAFLVMLWMFYVAMAIVAEGGLTPF